MASAAASGKLTAVGSGRKKTSKWLVNLVLGILCFIWVVPTLGLLVSSFRERSDVVSTGWWSILPHQEYVTSNQVQLTKGLPLDKPIQVEGVTVTNQQLRDGYKLPDGRKIIWANSRGRLVNVQAQQWTMNANFTLDNYKNVLLGQQYTYQQPDGSTRTEQGENMGNAFISSLTVAIPATVIPIAIAAFAAYGFAWMRFPGRQFFFAMVVALLVVPSQVALIPLLRAFSSLQVNGTYLSLWLVHTGFGLCLATYLLYNYISSLPRDLFESAFI